jgi:arsenical pump membrane protein
LAIKTVKASKGRGHKLFFSFFLLSAGMSVLTSNDIVVLTLTPIICALANFAKIDPIPTLLGQFFAANLSGVMLFTSNPTNIIVSEAYGISFLEYGPIFVNI